MRFAYWTREIAGWALIVISLMIFWTAYLKLMSRMIFEAGPIVFIGFIVFRGGIHILKVAVAAQAARSLPEAAGAPVRRMSRLPVQKVGPTPPKAVLPGLKSKPAKAVS